MLFNNDIEEMLCYLERFCKEPHTTALDNVSDEQNNLLLDFLTQDRAPQGNLFLKVESNQLYLTFELEACDEDNLLSPIRVIDALVYLSEKTGNSLLPESYKS